MTRWPARDRRPGQAAYAAELTRWGPPRPAPADPLSAAAGLTRPGGRPG